MRIVSGMRPTGPLHLGHYFGVIEQWRALQQEAECFFFVADWHALTTDYDEPGKIGAYSLDVVRDWIGGGIDPERAVLFRQSDVKAHAELQLLLGMLTPLSWLERVPSYKDMRENLADRDLSTFGFLGYPLLQTADIILYRADTVPVGADQLAHVELSRELVRRFHHLYQAKIFPEPQSRLTQAPKVPGTDGRKMSKSYGNAIFLGDDEKTVQKKVSVMVTDPQRVRKSDPGNPEVCDVFALHRLATASETVAEIDRDCRSAAIGCVACKKRLAASLEQTLAPIRARRDEIDDAHAREVLEVGAQRARDEAEPTMERVRAVLGLPTR